MQHIGIERADTKMLERADKLLLNLGGDGRILVLRQPVVLAVEECELCLQKQVLSCESFTLKSSGECFTDPGLKIMAPLVGGVDAAKTRIDRLACEASGVVPFPRSSIDESRNAGAFDVDVWIYHGLSLALTFCLL